jgi:ketosteroid isomerase-like protein
VNGLTIEQRFAIEGACRQLMMRYAAALDLNDVEGLLELFTQDGEWARPGNEPLRGGVQIAEFLCARDRAVTMRHIISNLVLDVEAPDRATALSYWTVMKGTPGATPAQALAPFAMGEYHDVFRLEQGRWRIARRETKFVFRST